MQLQHHPRGEFVPLKQRRTHQAKQDWPYPDEVPHLIDMLRVHGTHHPTGINALSRLQAVLEDCGLLPIGPERPSERAMRLSRR